MMNPLLSVHHHRPSLPSSIIGIGFLVPVLLLLLATTSSVHGQRAKEGCFDAASISCSNPRVDPKEVDFSMITVCQKLAVHVFPSDEIVFNPHMHPDYINSIEAETEFCSQIETAYSQCIFCAPDHGVIEECLAHTWSVNCGQQPTLQEVLQNNDDERYTQFQTQADIDQACQDMQEAYDWSFPITLELCERQTLVKHLCPGNCEGTCFDPDVYPPTCDPNAYKGPINASLDTEAICNRMGNLAFHFASMETIQNVSQHADYMRALPPEESGLLPCNEARQSYSDCTWCNPDMCFDESKPVVCQVPDNTTLLELHTTLEQDEEICRQIYFSFIDLDDLYNISKHTKHLAVKDGTELCNQARQSYYKCKWCAPPDEIPPDFCTWEAHCRGDTVFPVGFVSTTLQSLNMSTTTNPLIEAEGEEKCAEIYQHWDEYWRDHYTLQNCYNDAYLAQLCPDFFCTEAEAAKTIDRSQYLGATTRAQKRALIWVSRVAAILSFVGASYILYDIGKDSKKKRTVYHQLLVGMAIFDLVTAIAWAFATMPIDKEAAGHIEGARGTAATCTAQAFFIQLGFTSVFYNVSLAMYYVLVVAYDWREFQLKKVSMYMHLLPPLLGLVLAFAAIPSYHWLDYGCHLFPPPQGDMWPVLVFVVLPIGLAIVAIMSCMMMVYCKVRRQAQKSAKWSFGVSKASALEQAVFWQCLFYVLAFLVTWPILFAVYLASVDVNGPLGLTLLVAFVAPLQGFNNFLVYIRPKVFKAKHTRPTRPGDASSSTRWSRASVVARMRQSVLRRTTLASSGVNSMTGSTIMALRKEASNDSLGSHNPEGDSLTLDPSVAMAFQNSRNGLHDSGPSKLSAVQEASTAEEDAVRRSLIMKETQESTNDDVKDNNVGSDYFDDEDQN